MKLPPVIMTQDEIEEAEEASLNALRDWLEQQEQPKPRTRPVQAQTLRTKEAAQYIGVSEWKLRQLVVTGKIPVIRGKYFLFSVSDLDAWIRHNRETEVL